MTFLFLVSFLLPHPQHFIVWCYYKSSIIGKINRNILQWMGTRYISLKPLAFNEGIHRENLMKGGGKLKEDSVIGFYSSSCRAISLLLESTYSVCIPGCKTFWDREALDCFILYLYPFSFYPTNIVCPIHRSWS